MGRRCTSVALVLWLLTALSTPSNAGEKYWIANQAKWIVVGTFHKSSEFPWFDGWRVNGAITIDETLYGTNAPLTISATMVV